MELPIGKWIVLFVAFIIIIAGLSHFYSAYKANFDYRFDIKNMNEKERSILQKLGQIGISAWGIVYCMLGILFYQAAISFNAEEAGGLNDALNALGEQPFGVWVLSITAAELMTYGIYLLILSYYHPIYEA